MLSRLQIVKQTLFRHHSLLVEALLAGASLVGYFSAFYSCSCSFSYFPVVAM